MKKAFLALMLTICVGFLCESPALSEGNKDAGLTTEQAIELKQKINALREVFGIEIPAKAQPTQQQGSGKSVADVADKALELMKNMVADISITLSKVAPDVWRIMLKQQYAEAVSLLIVPWGLFFMCAIAMLIVDKKWIIPEDMRRSKKTENDKITTEMTEEYYLKVWLNYFWPAVFMIAFFIYGTINTAYAVKMFINPEFYAIKSLVLVLIGKG